MYVCMYVCICIFIYINIYVCMYVCMYVCTCICICICIRICICMYVFVYLYIQKSRGERVCQVSPTHRCCMLIESNPNKMGVGTGEKFSVRPEIPICIPIYRDTGISDRTASPEILFPDCHTPSALASVGL
jgi:hypothetical protein